MYHPLYSRSDLFSNLRLVPNQVTAVRFLLVPAIWGMALMGYYRYISIGLIVCLISDALDGYLARRLNQVTQFGGKFDSLADNILIPSAVGWLLIFKPAVFADHIVLSMLAIATYIASITIGLVKFQQFGNLHLYLSKISGIIQYIFVIHTFIVSHYSAWLFYLTISMYFLSSLETLLLQLISSEVSARMRSILFICKWHKQLFKEL